MTLDSPPAETRPDPSAWERAQTLSDLGRYADASAAVAEVISAQPREAQAWCLMARVQLGLERPAGALQAARTAAGLAPESEQPPTRPVATPSRGRPMPAWRTRWPRSPSGWRTPGTPPSRPSPLLRPIPVHTWPWEP